MPDLLAIAADGQVAFDGDLSGLAWPVAASGQVTFSGDLSGTAIPITASGQVAFSGTLSGTAIPVTATGQVAFSGGLMGPGVPVQVLTPRYTDMYWDMSGANPVLRPGLAQDTADSGQSLH